MSELQRNRIKSRFLFLLTIIGLTASAEAASVVISNLQTSGLPTPNQLEVHSSSEQLADLSSPVGLTPGQNILVFLSASEAPIYLSSFQPNGGPLSYSVTETLSLIIGANIYSTTVTISSSFPNVVVDGATTNIVGYQFGDLFQPIAVSVPWGTDLSAVKVRLSQDATITGGLFVGTNTAGVDGIIVGGTRLFNLALQATSVPEPSSLVLLTCLGTVVLRRRRQ